VVRLTLTLTLTLTLALTLTLTLTLTRSCGTAGFLVSIKVRLVRTKPFVRVRYEPTSSPEQVRG